MTPEQIQQMAEEKYPFIEDNSVDDYRYNRLQMHCQSSFIAGYEAASAEQPGNNCREYKQGIEKALGRIESGIYNDVELAELKTILEKTLILK